MQVTQAVFEVHVLHPTIAELHKGQEVLPTAYEPGLQVEHSTLSAFYVHVLQLGMMSSHLEHR